MTNEQLAKIKEAAEKATPGPWETSGVRSRFPNVDSLWININGERVIGLLCGSDKDYALSFRDQHHIAASNPKAVLDLIARLEAAEAELKTTKEIIAEANNSLFGSHAYFISVIGDGTPTRFHLSIPIEKLKFAHNETMNRASTARDEALEAAAKALQAMNPEYNDGPSMHVENMTLGRAVITICNLKEKS